MTARPDVVSYDTKQNPAPPSVGAPPKATYSAMHRYAVERVTAHEGRIAGLKRLLDAETVERERVTLQAMIDREEIAAEQAAAIARVLWLIHIDKGLKADIRYVAAAQNGAGDDDVDLTRYD